MDNQQCDGQKRDQVKQRREKLAKLREQGFNYPNDARPQHLAAAITDKPSYQEASQEQLLEQKIAVSIAGRMMTRRLMGKASFFNIQDRSGQIQVYARSNDLPEGMYEAFKECDLGDVFYIKGHVFKTKVGEISIYATEIRLLKQIITPAT